MYKRNIVFVVLLVLVAVGFFLMEMNIHTYGTNTGAVLLSLVASYLMFSFTIVNIDEASMMTEWGKPVGNKPAGWYFTPLGVVKIRKEKGTIFQDELPADPEKIYRGDGNPPDGMFPPIRVKFGQKNSADRALEEDPYNIPMVAEVVPVVSWHIDDATTFFRVMGDVGNCRKNMADKAVELFADKLAHMTPAKAALRLSKISQKLEIKLKAETATWGIVIDDAYIKPIIFAHELNDAVVKVKIADQNAKATVITAGAEKKKRIEEATGDAEAIKLKADADGHRLVVTGLAQTDGSGKITELNPDANVRVQAEALKELSKVTGTLVLGDATTMLGIGKKGGNQ